MRLPSRRELLLGAAAISASAAKPLVIDTHMHVWSMDSAKYPFQPPEPNYGRPKQAGTVEMYIEEMTKDRVDLAVLVQERSSGWNNRYISDCVRRFPKRFVGHGLIDPHDANNAAVLEREVKQNGLSGMRLSPIYHPPKRNPDNQWLNAPYTYPLWKKAEELGVVFNVFIAPAQMPQLEDMVQRYPKVKVVVDHLGRPDILPRAPWVENDSLLKLARYPNVWVKFTELYTASKTKEYPYKDVHPFGKMVYDKFGPRRLLFGTGMVAATRRIPLADELRLIREDIPFFADRDKEWILGRNAAKIWKFKSV
jgi:predicted TIM-barrel fold metal-dependent hydrolase